MAENPKIQSLSNDLIRRLLNTSRELPESYRSEVVNNYCVKLLTSGYGYDQTRRILMSGAKGYLAKVKRRTMDGGGYTELQRRAAQEDGGRNCLGKSNWFRDKKRNKEEVTEEQKQPGLGSKAAHGEGYEDKSSPLYRADTPGGAVEQPGLHPRLQGQSSGEDGEKYPQ